MPGRVCVLGSANLDLVVRAERFPRPGETVTDGRFATFPGGKGNNQAVAAARQGARVAFVACLGRDANGDTLVARIAAEGIDVEHVVRTSDHATGVALITVDARAENTIVVAPGANRALSTGDVDAARAAIAAADVLVAQLEVPLEVVAHAARLAREGGTAVLLNAAPYRPLPADLLEDVTHLIVNEGEARELAGLGGGAATPPPEELAQSLLESGVGHVLLTLGRRGACVASAGAVRRVPAPRVEAQDTTGCGDAFVGALAARLADGAELEQAARAACVAGALAATRVGAQSSLPTRAEVDEALAG